MPASSVSAWKFMRFVFVFSIIQSKLSSTGTKEAKYHDYF